MIEPLNAEALVDAAIKATGLDDFGGDSYREGLDVLIRDYNAGLAKGWMNQAGRDMAARDPVHWLTRRLLVTDYLTQHPELTGAPINRPLAVMGIPRTGTTLLSNLLACDPAHRSPLTWEIDEPVPPAAPGKCLTDPRALARLAQEEEYKKAVPDMFKYYRGSAIYPNECVFFLAHDFKTLMIESMGKLPEYREFLFSCDMSSAYAYHRKFLQLLQGNNPGVWNLKMPSHTLHLDALTAEYPDARLVWTHRDPLAALGSFCSLLRFSYVRSMDTPDIEWLAENCLWQASEHAGRAMDFRDKHGENRVIDVHYADLLDRPIETMEALYAALDDPFTDEARAGMQAWLDDNPQNKFGKHEYKLDEFGLSERQVRDTFERYLSRYAIAPEG
jgi:Sulfotransferase family